MREGIRAQGHSAICRTRDTAGERAAKRIKFQCADRPADPVSSSSASRSDATAGVMLQVLAEVPLQNENPLNHQILWQQYIERIESLSPESKVSRFSKEA